MYTQADQTRPLILTQMDGQPLPAIKAALTQNKYAIIVGVNDYANPSIRDLRYCVNDASEFRDVLVNECGYPSEHIVLLTDGAATRDRLEQELNQLTNRGQYPEADTIIFYYSGHGAVINGNNYLIPHDGSPEPGLAMSTNLSLEYVQSLLAKSDFPR